MTTTAQAAPAPTPAPTTRGPWARSRGPLLALLLLVVSGVILAALQSGEQHGRLDPRSADRTGSRALTRLLSSHGVSTQVVTTSEEAAAAAGPDTTLLVTDPDVLTQDQLTGLHTATAHTSGRTVLLAPGTATLATFTPGVRMEPRHVSRYAGPPVRCPTPAARAVPSSAASATSPPPAEPIAVTPVAAGPPCCACRPPTAVATPCSSAPATSSTTTVSPSTATPRSPSNSSVRTSIWSGTSPP